MPNDDEYEITAQDLIDALQDLIAKEPGLADAPIGIKVPIKATEAFYLFYPNKITIFQSPDDNGPEIHFVIDDLEVLNKSFRGWLN